MSGRRAAALAAVVLAIVLFPAHALAHTVGLSRGVYTPDGAVLRAVLVLRGDEAALAIAGLDGDGDGHLSALEVDRALPALQGAFVDALAVQADGAPCKGTLARAAPDPPDGLRLEATYACPAPGPARRLHMHFGFLDRLPDGHRHLATVHLPKGDTDTLALLARPDFDVDTGAEPHRDFASFLRAGVEHILTGADHLAFLLALVLGGTLAGERSAAAGLGLRRSLVETSRARSLIAMLTAFTVGHSASLAIATLGGFAPGPRLVEPAVALSVAYVGAENLLQGWAVRQSRRRWMLTLPFGFVHGFALAGGLLPLGLPRSELPAALLGFNLGVEGGQLLVLALLLPPLAWAAARWSGYARAARGVSVAILVAGLVWFVQRVA